MSHGKMSQLGPSVLPTADHGHQTTTVTNLLLKPVAQLSICMCRMVYRKPRSHGLPPALTPSLSINNPWGPYQAVIKAPLPSVDSNSQHAIRLPRITLHCGAS